MGIDAGTPPGLWEKVRKIAAEEVAKFMRSGFLRNASISDGGLTIKGGFLRFFFPETQGGGLAAFFGNIKNELTGSYLGTGLLVQDQQGRDLAQIRTDEATGATVIVLNDAQGNNVLSTFNAAVGLNRPFLHGGFTPARYADWTVTTASASFETLWRAQLHKQHPGMFVRTRASMDTEGTTGELRVMVDGQQLGPTRSAAYVLGTFDFGPADIPGGHMEFIDVEIQGRRTSATGTLRVAPGVWMGRSST